jgi:transcriptional repressor NrdR
MAEDIEDQLRELGPEVPSDAVGLAVLERLRALDPVSYLRFASVYKDFENVADFEAEVVLLQKTTAPKRPARSRT